MLGLMDKLNEGDIEGLIDGLILGAAPPSTKNVLI